MAKAFGVGLALLALLALLAALGMFAHGLLAYFARLRNSRKQSHRS